MQETLEGTGKLRRIGFPLLEVEVTYRIEITTHVTHQPGFPTITRKSSQGVVRAIANEHLPQGHYELETQDGETVKLQNIGTWHILTG
jgi:hypothetical protein